MTTFKRVLLVLGLLAAPSVSFAQAISGTLTGSHNGYTETGSPKVDYALSLACSLTCSSSAPDLHFRARSGIDWKYASVSTENAGSVPTAVSSEIDKTGQYGGTLTKLTARAVTCECGGRIGEGGYIDLSSQPIVIPPRVDEPFLLSDNEHRVAITAKPKGGETVDVRIVGAGLDMTKSITEADFGGNDGYYVPFFPTEAGQVTITATLMPWNSSNSVPYTVGNGGTSGSSPGAGTAGTPSKTASDDSEGCALGGSPSFSLGLLLLCAIAMRRQRTVTERS
jgi:hypothetical protein